MSKLLFEKDIGWATYWVLKFTLVVIPVLGFYLYIFIGVSRLGLRLGLGLGWRCCPSPTYIRVIHEISHGQFTHEIDCMWPLHFKHSHWWKRRSWSKFASCLRDQRSMWMQDGCKVYMDSCMVSNGLCFMVTWTILKNHRPPLLPPETPRCSPIFSNALFFFRQP